MNEKDIEGKNPTEKDRKPKRRHLSDFSSSEIEQVFKAENELVNFDPQTSGHQFYAFRGLVDADYKHGEIYQITSCFSCEPIYIVLNEKSRKIDYISLSNGGSERYLLPGDSLVVRKTDSDTHIVRKATLVTHPRLVYEYVKIGKHGYSIERTKGQFFIDDGADAYLSDFERQIFDECIEEGGIGEMLDELRPYQIDQAGNWPESPKKVAIETLRDEFGLQFDLVTPAKGQFRDIPYASDIKTNSMLARDIAKLVLDTPEIKILEFATRGNDPDPFYDRFDEVGWDNTTNIRVAAHQHFQAAKGLKYGIRFANSGKEKMKDFKEAQECKKHAHELLESVSANPITVDELQELAKAVVRREMAKFIVDGKIDRDAVRTEKKVKWLSHRTNSEWLSINERE